jgi:hypothetical protein
MNKKFIVKVLETSQRTIELNMEIEVPNAIIEELDEEGLDEYIQEKIEGNDCTNIEFVDIVDSQIMDMEILEVTEGELPVDVQKSYTIEM